MIPAIIYGAKSTKDPHASIPNQLKDAHAAAEEAGHEVLGSYEDEAASAYTGNRGQGLADAKDHAVRLAAEHGEAHLWVQHSDRLARGDGLTADHLGEVWFAMRRGGVRLRSADDDHNLEDALRVVLMGERNHEDSKRKAENVAKGHRRRRVERGGYHGGPEPFGFIYPRDASGRTLPEEPLQRGPHAPSAARMFQLVEDGLGTNAIAKTLNREGVPTAQEGKRWHSGTVRRIITNPIYAGRAKDGSELRHEGIVSWETFQKVQAILASRARGSAKGGRPSPALFVNGHLRCGQCGGTMGYRAKPNAGGSTWRRYVCTEREHDRTVCDQRPVPVDALEAAVIHELERRAHSRSKSEEAWRMTLDADLAHVARLAADAEREATKARCQMERAERDYLSGELSAKRYEPMAERLESELAAAQAQAVQLADRELAMRAHGSPEVADRYSQALLGIGALPLARQREVLRSLFPHLTLQVTERGLAVDLGEPAPAAIAALVDDELAGREGEAVLARLGAAATDALGLTSAPVVAPIPLEL